MNEDSKQEKRYNYFYRIDNLVNSKFYYGIHSTNNLEDGYMGSGFTLKKAKKKYGIENFKKTILLYFASRDALATYEREFITPEFLEINRGICYNEKPGGDGGWLKHSSETRKIMSEKAKGRKHSPETIEKLRESHKRVMTEEMKQRISNKLKGRIPWNKGIPATEEHKRKNSESNKGKKHSEEWKKNQSEGLKRHYSAKKSAQTQVA